jgi:hypothetical protein
LLSLATTLKNGLKRRLDDVSPSGLSEASNQSDDAARAKAATAVIDRLIHPKRDPQPEGRQLPAARQGPRRAHRHQARRTRLTHAGGSPATRKRLRAPLGATCLRSARRRLATSTTGWSTFQPAQVEHFSTGLDTERGLWARRVLSQVSSHFAGVLSTNCPPRRGPG